MDRLRYDIAYAFRRLSRAPGFAGVAILTLALGIGANTAIFSVVYGVLIKPLPYPDPDRLVRVFQIFEGRRVVFSPPNFLDVQRLTRTLESVAAVDTTGITLTRNDQSERLDAAEVSASFFDVLRVRPELGRAFRADDHANGRTKVAVLSHGLWLQRFGADRRVVGQKVTLEGEPYEIVGVMPAGFEYPRDTRLWVPFLYDQDFRVDNRGAWFLTTIGRLRPGASAEAASSELHAIASQLEKQFPNHNARVGMGAAPLQETMVQPIRPALLMLLGAVGAVLLIACVNVANLLLARAATRSTELAVRAALGAGRPRLVRQLFTESLILAGLGGLSGILLSAWLTDLLIAWQPEGIPRLEEIGLNPVVLAFTAGVSVLTAVLFGLVPALQVTRGNLASGVKEAGRSGDAGGAGGRMRRVLVVAEIALALMLLAGAGLLIRSFSRLTSVDPGFAATDALTFRFAVPARAYSDDGEIAAVVEQAIDTVRSVPGVTDAGATIGLPLTGVHFTLSFDIKGRPPRGPGDSETLEVRVVTPEYFRAIGLPLRRGRAFTRLDRAGREKVVILSETAVRRHFPNEDPIGKYVELGWRRVEGGERVGGRVVGVVGDAREHGFDEEFPPEIYVPHAQAPLQSMQFVVRTAVPPASIAEAVVARLRELEPGGPVYRVKTLEDVMSESVAEPRFYMLLLGAFAVVALVLATVGIFGVMSYAVAQRTREIGIRMALGARPATVISMVLGQALQLIGVGILTGVALAVAASRSLQKLLFDLSPTDPATIAGVAILLACVALLAGYVPARRATRVDPLIALRSE